MWLASAMLGDTRGEALRDLQIQSLGDSELKRNEAKRNQQNETNCAGPRTLSTFWSAALCRVVASFPQSHTSQFCIVNFLPNKNAHSLLHFLRSFNSPLLSFLDSLLLAKRMASRSHHGQPCRPRRFIPASSSVCLPSTPFRP